MPPLLRRLRTAVSGTLALTLAAGPALPQTENKPADDVKAEHAQIGVGGEKVVAHTAHPDALWFPDGAFGLFIHWGLSSVRAMNISWPMIPGRVLAKRIESATERARIVREGDYNLTGQPPEITPNQYWEMAKSFDPSAYDPDKWIRAAKEAGFTYAVLTAKHHEGYALWPSAFGDFNTKKYAKGKDLVAPFVEACRRHGLKVGLYFSGPDWYFDRDHYSFLYGGARRANPEFPPLDADLKPRTETKTAEEIGKHQAAYAALVKGQIEELLTRYGKIDVLWFDGKPNVPEPEKVITVERIRQLQPGIVINPRMHGHGDYEVWEREQKLPKERPKVEWGEFCSTWTRSWAHEEIPFRAPGYVLGKLALVRSWRVNYLLGVGPMSNGEMAPGVYENMAAVAGWMKSHRASIHGTRPLPKGESASVPATSRASTRYLFAAPSFKDGSYGYPEDMLPAADETLTLSGVAKPKAVVLLGTGEALEFTHADGVLTVPLPASRRTKRVDVVEVTLPQATAMDEGQPAMIVAEVEARIRSFESAQRARDAEGLLAHFAPSPSFHLYSDGQRLGYDTMAAGVRQAFPSLRSIEGGFEDVEILVIGPDAALATGAFRETVTDASGQTRRMRGAASWLWRRVDGEWRIAYGHVDHYPDTD